MKQNTQSRRPVATYSREIVAFNGFLESLKSILIGVDYVTFFEAKEFELPNGKLPIRACLCSVGLGQTGVDETRIQSGLSQRLERRAMASGGACSS